MTIRKNKKTVKSHRASASARRRLCLDHRAPPPPRDYTVSEWCAKRRVSRFLFYKMLKQGTAPKTMKLNKRRTISVEADEKWQREREAETTVA